MRNITMISTKDYFIYVSQCDATNEEVFSETTGQNISFVANGSLVAFRGGKDNWSPWSSDHSLVAPLLTTRVDNTPFGCAASSESGAVVITLVPKEDATTGNWKEHTELLANEDEVINIVSDSSFIVAQQCFATTYRDLSTYEISSANTFAFTDEIVFT